MLLQLAHIDNHYCLVAANTGLLLFVCFSFSWYDCSFFFGIKVYNNHTIRLKFLLFGKKIKEKKMKKRLLRQNKSKKLRVCTA